ncbi:MAG TPA: glycoside hydrolase family 15 protein [Alphaproteobacteria bacterium]
MSETLTALETAEKTRLHEQAETKKRIEDYALIGDTSTCALVGRDGSIDWLCPPNFDSPACFAALLGTAENGRWLIAPQERPSIVTRRYIDDTLVLETRFGTSTGTACVTDFMPLNRGEATDIIRIVTGIEGVVPMKLDIRFRFDYGHIIPWVRRSDDGIIAIAGPDAIRLSTKLPLEGRGWSTVSEFRVAAGERIPVVLTWHRSYDPAPPQRDPDALLRETRAWWVDWSGPCNTLRDSPKKWRNATVRSAITLKALTHARTGGMVAAATTSLPEFIGGVRNWDYRYCWLRDATFTLYALMCTGFTEEARSWRDWLVRAAAGKPDELQIMYSLAGERRLPESELPWLPGFGNSRPVRIGNAAYVQQQLDVYGEVIDALHYARRSGLDVNDDAWRVQLELVRYLEKHWRDPGSGLWEQRTEPRRYVYSTVMAWAAFDRTIRAIERYKLDLPTEPWKALRKAIHDEVCQDGFSTRRNAFVQYFGGEELDASALLIPLVGFLPISDPRIVATVDTIQRNLMADGFVLRYFADESADGLPAGEGAFLACSLWLADNLALMGRFEEAEEIFERVLGVANDVGLLAEEYDPLNRCQLGNFPQAFSHVGVINTVRNLTLAAKARQDKVPATVNGEQVPAASRGEVKH